MKKKMIAIISVIVILIIAFMVRTGEWSPPEESGENVETPSYERR